MKKTKRQKTISLAKAEVSAKKILKHHQAIVELRAPVLLVMREVIRKHEDVLAKCGNGEVEWMVEKLRRGYFGTDVKSNQLLGLIVQLRRQSIVKNNCKLEVE